MISTTGYLGREGTRRRGGIRRAQGVGGSETILHKTVIGDA